MRAVLLVALLALPVAAPALLLPAEAATDPQWTNSATPAGANLQDVQGRGAVLLASPFKGPALRSLDAGQHWSPVTGFPAVTKGRVAFDATTPGLVYIAGFGGVARSRDDGATWDWPLHIARAARIAVSISGLVLVADEAADGTNHVLRSADQGATWSDLAAPLPADAPLCGVGFLRTEQELFVMTNASSWYSHDAGLTWNGVSGTGRNFAVEPDGTAWRAGVRHLERSTDGGATWRSITAPAYGTALTALPQGGIALASTQGLLRTRDGGATWDNASFADVTPDVNGLAPDPQDAHALLLAGAAWGAARIEGEGAAATFHGLARGMDPVDVNALGGSGDGSLLLAAGPVGVFASRDQGLSWAHTGTGRAENVTALASSADGTTAYAGGILAQGIAVVESSLDGARHFDRVALPVQAPAAVGGLAVDARDAQHAFAAVRTLAGAGAMSVVFETRDGGATWAALLSLPVDVNDVAWNPGDSTLLVGTALGAFAHDDLGLWSPRSASPDATLVAVGGGFAYASGIGKPVWREVPPAGVMEPWADPGAPIDLAPDPANAALFVATADGVLHLCLGDVSGSFCKLKSPPQNGVRAVTTDPTGNLIFAGTSAATGGLWRFDRGLRTE